MTDKLSKAAQQALYAMAMLIDPEKLEPWQIELYDKSTNALRTALVDQPAEPDHKDMLIEQLEETNLWQAKRISELLAEQKPVGTVKSISGPNYENGLTAVFVHTDMNSTLKTGDPLYTAPQPAKPAEQEPYDQTALELCDVCGWKTLIPGDGCLNCERQTAKREPLTDEDVQDLLKVGNPTEDEYRLIRMGWDAAHGIGGQE